MKYLSQFLIILGFTFAGEALQRIIPLPIPASIYGMVLLFLALQLKLISIVAVKDMGGFLTSILPVLFVSPSVRILEYWGIIGPNMAAIAIIAVSTTFLVFAVSALVTQRLMKKEAKKTS